MGRLMYKYKCTMLLTQCSMRDISNNGRHGLGGWSMVGMPWEGPGMAGGRMGESGGIAPIGNESVVNKAKQRQYFEGHRTIQSTYIGTIIQINAGIMGAPKSVDGTGLHRPPRP